MKFLASVLLLVMLSSCSVLNLAAKLLGSTGNSGQQISTNLNVGDRVKNRDGYRGSHITVRNGNTSLWFTFAMVELLIITLIFGLLLYAYRSPDFGRTHEKIGQKK